MSKNRGGRLEVNQKINIQKTLDPKAKPDEKNLGFGEFFTDHMFIMDYSREKGWHDPDSPVWPCHWILHNGFIWAGTFEPESIQDRDKKSLQA